jgi:pyruvate ferredoxin oxidoreductase delta subunit
MSKLVITGYVEPGSTAITKTGAWRTFVPHVNPNNCIKCSLCEIYCPEACIHQVDSGDSNALAELGYEISEISVVPGKTIFLPDKNYCKGCGICVHECPRNARTLKGSENAIELLLEEK